jgi:hypothetical protein
MRFVAILVINERRLEAALELMARPVVIEA